MSERSAPPQAPSPEDAPPKSSTGRADIRLGKAVRWAYIMNWTEQGSSAVILFVLAGILGPYDFGVAAMAMVFAAFVDIFLDQGFSTAIIQRKEIEPAHCTAVFWILLGASVVLMGLTFLLSPWWAERNDLPALATILNVLALRLPLGALSKVHSALFQRNLDYRRLSIRNSIAVMVGGLFGVGMAIAGFGVWSLVGQQLVKETVSTLLIWFLSPWRSEWSFSKRHARELIGFSSSNLLARLGVFTVQQIDALLIGLFFGPTAVGIYRLAARVVGLLMQVLTRSLQAVSLPELSRYQDQPERLKSSALKLLRMSMVTTFPVYAVVAACNGTIMAAIGSKWADAGPVLAVLCIMGVVQSAAQFCGPVLQAASRPGVLAVFTWLQGGVAALAFAGLAAWLTGRGEGDNEVMILAFGRAFSTALCALPVLIWVALPRAHLGLADLARLTWPSALAALAAGCSAILVDYVVSPFQMPALVELILVGGTAMVCGLCLLLLVDPLVRDRASGYFRRIRPVARTSQA